MKKISINQIGKWMHRNARELELSQWKYHFENGTKEDVIKALTFYQNEDGGFGNKAEPDNWNPNSTPYAVFHAIEIINTIEYENTDNMVMKGIKRYIENSIDAKYGWRFTIPSNDDYPHAPWFNFSDKQNSIESIGIEASFCLFIIKYYPQSAVYDKVLEKANNLIKLLDSNQLGDMGPTAILYLIETMKCAKVGNYDYSELESKIYSVVNGIIQRDKAMWSIYGYRPSDCINGPSSLIYKGNEAIVEEELNFYIESLPNDDVWPISWTWFDNMEKYSREFAFSEVWYKSIKAIYHTLFLHAFGRVKQK